MMRNVVTTMVALLVGAPAQAAVALNQLSDCSSLARLDSFMRQGGQVCRAARGAIETRLATMLEYGRAAACFLETSPTSRLTGFSCVVVEQHSGERSIVCFRPASMSDVRRYQQNVDTSFAEPTNDYLAAASACSAGNGDAASAERNVAPLLLNLFARYEFGFILPAGGRLVGRTAFVHGYAQVDPALAGSNDAAVEFLSYWVKP